MLFAMIRAGMRKDALMSNTPWICVSCYHCVVRCPQNVHIADVMYTLKSMAIEAGLYRDSTAPDFSHTFVDMVEEWRSFEFGRNPTLSKTSHEAAQHGPMGSVY
jgi:heterodisulfide reductase subunit C